MSYFFQFLYFTKQTHGPPKMLKSCPAIVMKSEPSNSIWLRHCSVKFLSSTNCIFSIYNDSDWGFLDKLKKRGYEWVFDVFVVTFESLSEP